MKSISIKQSCYHDCHNHVRSYGNVHLYLDHNIRLSYNHCHCKKIVAIFTEHVYFHKLRKYTFDVTILTTYRPHSGCSI